MTERTPEEKRRAARGMADRERDARKRPARRPGPRVIPVTKGNPAVVRSVVVAVLGLLATLGVGWAADVPGEVVDALVTLLVVLGPVVAGLWIRFGVTPNAKVVSRVTTDGNVVAGDASTVVTGGVLTVRDTVVGPVVEPTHVDPKLVGRSDL